MGTIYSLFRGQRPTLYFFLKQSTGAIFCLLIRVQDRLLTGQSGLLSSCHERVTKVVAPGLSVSAREVLKRRTTAAYPFAYIYKGVNRTDARYPRQACGSSPASAPPGLFMGLLADE